MSVEYGLYAYKWEDILARIDAYDSFFDLIEESGIPNHLSLADDDEWMLFRPAQEFMDLLGEFRKANDTPELRRLDSLFTPMLWAFAGKDTSHRIVDLTVDKRKLEMVEWAFSPSRTHDMSRELGALNPDDLERVLSSRNFSLMGHTMRGVDSCEILTSCPKYLSFIALWQRAFRTAETNGCGLLVYVFG